MGRCGPGSRTLRCASARNCYLDEKMPKVTGLRRPGRSSLQAPESRPGPRHAYDEPNLFER